MITIYQLLGFFILGSGFNWDKLFRFAVVAVAVVAAVDETVFIFGVGAVVGAALGRVAIGAIGGVVSG